MGRKWEDMAVEGISYKDLNENTIQTFLKKAIEEEQGGISITFFKDIYTQEYLTNLGLAKQFVTTLLYVKENGSITNSQYQKIFNVSKRKSTIDLQYLANENFIEKVGTRGRGTFYRLKLR